MQISFHEILIRQGRQESSHIQEAWHSFIESKCRPWSHKSDINPPEGDTKPPGGNNP